MLEQIKSNIDEREVQTLIKSARIVNQLQNKNPEIFGNKEDPNFITYEKLSTIVNFVKEKVEKNIENKKYITA